jgi:hypothetical protein
MLTNSVAMCLLAAGCIRLRVRARYAQPSLHEPIFQLVGKRNDVMRKALPDTMFGDPERSRLTMLRTWVLDNQVTEIEMNERQFWNFAQLQPVAEKPWVTFMGRIICVSDMPIAAQKQLGIFDTRNPAAI